MSHRATVSNPRREGQRHATFGVFTQTDTHRSLRSTMSDSGEEKKLQFFSYVFKTIFILCSDVFLIVRFQFRTMNSRKIFFFILDSLFYYREIAIWFKIVCALRFCTAFVSAPFTCLREGKRNYNLSHIARTRPFLDFVVYRYRYLLVFVSCHIDRYCPYRQKKLVPKLS